MTQPVSPPRPPQTLHESLAGRVSGIRGRVHGCIGDRPYRLWCVVRRWSGGEAGRGTPEEVSRVELRCGRGCDGSPVPPKVVLSGGYSRAMHGLVENGFAVVEELDPTYTESEIALFGRIEARDEAFFELAQDGRDGDGPTLPRRRFTLEGVPYRDSRVVGWTMRLREQEPSAPFAGAQLAPDGSLP